MSNLALEGATGATPPSIQCTEIEKQEEVVNARLRNSQIEKEKRDIIMYEKFNLALE